MTTPAQNTWQKIYTLTAELYNLSPWNAMEERDIFGVQMPDSGKCYFISIMGSAGIMYGMSAYEGNRALGQFWELQSQPENADPKMVLSIPHLIVTYDQKEFIDPDHLALIKEHAPIIAEKDIWPDVKQVIPGRVPTLPAEDKACDFVHVLEQALDVCRRAKNDIDFLFPENNAEDEYLIRKRVSEGDSLTWKDEYRRIDETPVQYDFSFTPEQVEQLMQLPKKSIVLQTDIAMLPTPVNDEQEGPFFPFLLIAACKKTGTIEGFQLLQPKPDIDAMHSNVPAAFMEMMTNAGYRPADLEVRDPLLHGLLKETLAKAGINITRVSGLEMVDNAIESFLQDMG
ncbi:MAG: hypothetical protein GVY19_01185 [Bacteroidetes bacterium]|jgi:hypothetical protein|nr:hypothetical protein [Bacteroidota bacterium]